MARGSGPVERRQVVLERLLRDASVDVVGLAQELAVSRSTIRRDLETLERQGALRRRHGGASVQEHVVYEQSYQERMRKHSAEKIRIAIAAGELIGEGEVIALSGGTTTMQIARAIKHRPGITVVTNAVNVATELASSTNLRVVVVGGTLRSPSFELTGPLSEQCLQSMYFDRAFIGVDGLTVAQGITTHNEIEALTNRAMLRQAQKVYVVADHSKIGRVAFAAIAPLSSVHWLITDEGIPEAALAQLRAAGLQVIVAG